MALLLALIFLVFPLAELAVIVTVANSIGVFNTLGLLVVVSIVGAWLAKREGLGVINRVRAALDRGDLPSREVADGFLILFAGALMLAPGFITDVLAILLLIPPTRAVVRTALVSYAVRRGRVAVVSSYGGGRTARSGSTGVWDAESWEETPGSPRDHDGHDGRELGGKT
jgi:UPF0716 protein FxsA